jgi:hypothetical protein
MYVIVKNDEEEATFKQSGKNFSLITIPYSRFTVLPDRRESG